MKRLMCLPLVLVFTACFGNSYGNVPSRNTSVFPENTQPKILETLKQGPPSPPIGTKKPYKIHDYLPDLGKKKGTISVYVHSDLVKNIQTLFPAFKGIKSESIKEFFVQSLEEICQDVGIKGIQQVSHEKDANLILDGFDFSTYIETSSLPPRPAHMSIVALTYLLQSETVNGSDEEKEFLNNVFIKKKRYSYFDNNKTGAILYNFDYVVTPDHPKEYYAGIPNEYQSLAEDVKDFKDSASLQRIYLQRVLGHEFGHYLGLAHTDQKTFSFTMEKLGLKPVDTGGVPSLMVGMASSPFFINTLSDPKLSLEEKTKWGARYNRNDSITLQYLLGR